MSQKIVEGQSNMPVWMRFFSLFMGILLIGDGMRRFVAPQRASDFYSFLMYIFVGSIFFLIFGYSRRLYLNEEGLFRRTNIWGRKTNDLLITWDKIERVIYSEKRNAFTVCFEYGVRGYRMSVDLKDKDSLCELIQSFYTSNLPGSE